MMLSLFAGLIPHFLILIITAFGLIGGALHATADAVRVELEIGEHRHNVATATSGGQVIVLDDGRIAVVGNTSGEDAGDDNAVQTLGVFQLKKASGVVFALGDSVIWDVGGSTAIIVANRDSATGDVYAGKCVFKAGATADLNVHVDINVPQNPDPLLKNSVAVSTAITNVLAETDFDVDHTINANSLRAGDVIEIFAQGIATATNTTDTLVLNLEIGGNKVITTPAVDVADDDIFVIHAFVTVRSIGATGKIIGAGLFGGADAPSTHGFGGMDSIAETTIDTTADILVAISAKWSVADAGNSVQLEQLIVKKQSA